VWHNTRMAKKRKKTDDVPPNITTDRHLSPRVAIYMPAELLAALDAEAEANDRTRTSEIIRAVRTHLRNAGRWPPPPPPRPDDSEE
jgi:hypothetical protein